MTERTLPPEKATVPMDAHVWQTGDEVTFNGVRGIARGPYIIGGDDYLHRKMQEEPPARWSPWRLLWLAGPVLVAMMAALIWEFA